MKWVVKLGVDRGGGQAFAYEGYEEMAHDHVHAQSVTQTHA